LEARLPSLLGSLASKKFMAKKFQKTVNLREKMKQSQSWAKDRQEGIDNIYNEARINKKDWQKIIRPVATKVNEKLVKRIVLILAVLIAIFLIYWLYFNKNENAGSNIDKEKKWYAVKLVDGTEWYGQIGDIASDPVVMDNLYYNYDQMDKNGNNNKQPDSLRLVKRGQETHGPDGSVDVVRAQILYMEPLAVDSKVLKAILEYEK